MFEPAGAGASAEPRRPTTSVRGLVDPAAARRGFELVRVEPAPDLADLVERHWVVRWDLPPGAAFTQVLVPHPVANVVAEESGYVAHGIPPGLFERTLTGSGAVVGTKLRPGAFRVLLGHPDAVRPGVQVPAAAGERAGVVVRQSEDDHVRLLVDGGPGDERRVVAVHRRGGTDAVVGETTVTAAPGEPVVVGLRVRGQDYGLVAGPADGPVVDVATVDGRTLDSAAAGGFLGLWLGVHATSEGRPSTSVVRVERFVYEPVA